MKTVHELRRNGFKVRVLHHQTVNGFGGATVVDVTTDTNTHSSVSLCSYKDQYNKKLGVRIALGRVFKQMGMSTK